jgi:hypothetical protein
VSIADIAAAVYGDADWYPSYAQEIEAAMRVAWAPLRFQRLRDVTGRYVNVVDGERVTWSPPVCECPTLTVWAYGGSTLFGIGQRDEHTIASELARVAWEAGIRLEVVNKGVPGDAHWREGLRFAWDLTRNAPPDLALFYDGVNDSIVSANLQLDIDEPIDLTLNDWAAEVAPSAPEPAALPDGVELVPPVTGPELDGAERGRLVMTRYESSRRIAFDVGRTNQVPLEFFWQPNRLSRPQLDGEPTDVDPYGIARDIDAAERRAIPDDVHDLTHVFDGNTDPMFTDDVHHDERAARIIALAMFEDLRPTLDRLLADR